MWQKVCSTEKGEDRAPVCSKNGRRSAPSNYILNRRSKPSFRRFHTFRHRIQNVECTRMMKPLGMSNTINIIKLGSK